MRAVCMQGVCCGDEFNFSAVDVTAAGFTLVSVRSDAQSGWGVCATFACIALNRAESR